MKFVSYFLSFTFFILCISERGMAQTDKNKYEIIADMVRKGINDGNSDTVYQMTSANFQKKMTAAKFRTGMNKFKANNGYWQTLSFKSENEKGMDFLATFELSQQIFSLKLDNEGKIERLNFEEIPFKKGIKGFKIKNNNPLKTNIDQLVDSLVNPYIQQSHTAGLVVAIIKQGKVLRYSYGTTDKKKEVLPDPTQTIFEIGSITKTFTSLLLAKQVVAKRMQLSDNINKYLPDSIPLLSYHGKSIKLVHLANHTAGLPRLPENIFNGNVNPRNPYFHYNRDSLFSYLKHFQLKSSPGINFSYSNYGAGLLGTILEMTTQASFATLLKKEITSPLAMTSTYIEIPANRQHDLAKGYNEKGLETSPWDLASLKGSGAIRSTLNDMVKYANAQMSGKSLLAKAIDLSHQITFESKEQAMGLGWRIKTYQYEPYYYHAGGTGGFRSFVGFNKKHQLGIVILSNTAEEVAQIGETLIQKLLSSERD